MVDRQRTTPGERIRFGGLSLTKVDTGRRLNAPIVDRVIELDRATWAVGCNVNGSLIGHNYRRTTGHSLNGGGAYRHINFRDLEIRRGALSRWTNQW